MAKSRRRLSKEEILERREKEHRRHNRGEPEAIGEVLPEVMQAAEQTWAERVEAERPQFAPVPPGFFNTLSIKNVKVNTKTYTDTDGYTRSITGLQFAENRKVTRAEQSDLVDDLELRGFKFYPSSRQWLRFSEQGAEPGDNTADAAKYARWIDNEIERRRTEGMER